MKSLKSKFYTLLLLFSVFCFTQIPQSANAFYSDECKWELIDCPGWGTGDREVCLLSGDGNTCTCGQVTRSCPKVE